MKYTLRDIVNSVFRYSRAMIIFWLVVLIAAFVFYTQTRKLYDSKAKILISMGSEAMGKADYINGKNLMLLQREQQIHNEQQILQSHEVMLTTAKWIVGDSTPGWHEPVRDARMEEARRYFENQDSSPTILLGVTRALGQTFDNLFGRKHSHNEQLEYIAQQLLGDLSVKTIFDSDALDVNFRYRNPNVAQTALSLLIDAYLQHHIAVFQNNAEADLLKVQLEKSVNNYHDRLGAFSSFMTSHQVYNDDAQVTVLVEQREKLKQSLNEAIADADAARARLASLNGIQTSINQMERYSTTQTRNKQRDALLAKLDDASVEEQSLLARHPKESRAYQEEQSKLDEIRHLLEKEPEQVVQETEQRKPKASEFVESEIINVTEAQRGEDARVQRLQGDLQRIDSQINNYATDLKGFNSLKLDLNLAKQESEQMAQVYVGSKLKTLTSQNAITDISVIDVPTLDTEPATPNKKLALAATFLLLVIGTFAVLFISIGFDTTITDPATAELGLGIPVVTTIPFTRRDASSRYFADSFTQQNQREFAKIYQAVSDRASDGKIILITGSSSKEGVSLIGYGLARFLGRYARQKTAFVDRTEHPVTPSMDSSATVTHDSTFLAWSGESTSPNRSESAAAASDVVLAFPHDDPGADISPALLRLRQEFAYVVVAVGPVRDSSDLLTLASIVSGVLFVVEAAKTRRAAARFNLDLLKRYGFQGVRLVLNKRIFYIPGWLMRFV